ncbi:MgtC/SapB family protein [Candidatus Kaiserbacteria bacterium]|nr:MgtC/SapB family protein [Candidatus Kaiserbacteria bacterium]
MEPVFVYSTLVIFGQLLLAAFLGMLLGTERSVIADKRAGTRTYALVSLGACLFSIVSIKVTSDYLGLINFDPMRVAAGIITGIGFLGAGLIIFKDNTLQGLTTAAGLWVSAGVGIAVAYGLFAIAIFTTLLTLVIFTVLWSVENKLQFLSDARSRLRFVNSREENEPHD